MPTHVKVIHARDFVRATAEGAFDLERSGRLLVEIFTAGAHLDDFDVILDTRKAKSDLSAAELWSLAARLANYRRLCSGKTAVLCPTERFESATFFSVCAENRGLEIRPFTSFEDAMEWLIEDESGPEKKLIDLGAGIAPFRGDAPHTPASRLERGSSPGSELLQIEEVDTVTGLKRVAGNVDLYRNLLAKFAEGQAGTPDAIRRALHGGDRGLAERLAHTLKGVAGNIGAGAVQEIAGTLERAIREGAVPGQLIDRLEADLSLVAGRIGMSLTALAPQPAVTSALPPADPQMLKGVLTQLMALVAQNDGGALDCLSDNAQILQAGLSSAEFSAIATALNGFEFDAALERIKAAAGSLQ